jgi:hypothetical protein
MKFATLEVYDEILGTRLATAAAITTLLRKSTTGA